MSLISELTRILKEANSGFNFEDDGSINSNAPVNPHENQTPATYEEVRTDEINSVLQNSKKIDFTNEFGNYLRLLMPQYARRVEVEDLDRNFWVIAQTLAAICKYLIEGLDIHKEIVILPNSKDYGYFKYDNFDNYGEGMNISEITVWTNEYCENWENIIFERLSYLKNTYPNHNLLILPVIRQDNYYHNYYKKEIYLGVYSYNKNENEEKFYWFYNNNNEIEPIIMEVTPTINKYVYHLAEDQLTLKFYWAFGEAVKQQTMQDHTLAYITALRALPSFSKNNNNISIEIEDALGKALFPNSDLYSCNYNIVFSNNKYKWTKETHIPTYSGEEEGEITQSDIGGYYLGELSSQREVYSDISDYDLSFSKHYIRPIVPSYFQIHQMLKHPTTLSEIRSSSDTKYLSTTGYRFLDTGYDAQGGKDPSTLRFYNLLGTVPDSDRETYEHEKFMVYTDEGKVNDHYQNYKSARDNKNVMTQHGEDAAIIDLSTEQLKKKYTNDLKVHFYTHPLSLQKIYSGEKADIEDKLNTILTAHYDNNGQPQLQEVSNIRNKDGELSPGEEHAGYLVYEYDGYLTSTSCNTSKPANNSSLGRTFADKTYVDILRVSPRRDINTGGSPNTVFKSQWQEKHLAPFQIIAVDNGEVPRAYHTSSTDPSGSGETPRFTHALEEFIYGAIVQIPYSTSASLCYPINNYNLFENALKHSLAFWRPKFRIDEMKKVKSEDYGRRHKIYTTITYYKHKDKSNILMLKIVNVGITFGPQVKIKIDDNDNVIVLTVPEEYQKGYYLNSEPGNWITFNKSYALNNYQNKAGQSKYLSPLAPLYCCGWPIRSSTDTPVAWANNRDDDTVKQTTNLCTEAQKILCVDIESQLAAQNPEFNNINYAPLYTKPINVSTKGTDGTVLPINTDNSALTFTYFGDLQDAITSAKSSSSSVEVDLFTKKGINYTLNEGVEYDNAGQCKFYGFSTLVHTMYVKIDLNNDGISEHYASILKRVDYDNNLINNNQKLVWEKETNGFIKDDDNVICSSQAEVETYLADNFNNSGSKGDFANTSKELLFDFSRYPSNGQTSQKNLDPTPEVLFATSSGKLTPTNIDPTYDNDITLDISLPEQTAYGNYTLTDDTITGTGIAQQDTKYYVFLALKCTDDELTETIPSVQYTINGSILTPESDVGNIKTFKVEIQTGMDTITISAEHSGYCTENKTLTVTVQPETPSEENPE